MRMKIVMTAPGKFGAGTASKNRKSKTWERPARNKKEVWGKPLEEKKKLKSRT
jgi:hypothetical protein